ncbi:DNA polymerase epsilon subunit B [Macrophomina phaseolina]|uniref:DNA polymerase epsilon subunit B n=1 Tax=Macrophomina phaseolina TaxID=35725 RepID=A0ABQ8GKE0_9PEZI|nr:DNA polymerase epsilon subunit B [Macrophomina phaseolina]
MASLSRRAVDPASDPVPSSSPAFATPPVNPARPLRTAPVPAPPALKPTVLPIILPPATLRPLAFRTFTKKHNLTLTSSALASLATFIGRHCGSGWREEGLAERVLEEVARAWKKGGGQVIVDGEGPLLKNILKTLEGCMSGGRVIQVKNPSLSRDTSFKFGDLDATNGRPALLEKQDSFGISKLNVADDDEDDGSKDPRDWIKVIGGFDQPKMVYNVTKKHFDRSTAKQTLFPNPSLKTEMFRQRYHIIHQRLLRNEAFQTPTFAGNRSSLQRSASMSISQINKITPISNLLGRHGSNHLLLGLLTVSPTGTLALSDLTGSIALDVTHARPIPEDGAWFSPGMIVLVDGTYEEDYGNPHSGSASSLGATGGIGGTIGGKFISFSIGHPPPEKRSLTLGTPDSSTVTDPNGGVVGPAFGWTDFLGTGSERATGARMRRIENRLLNADSPAHRQTKIAIAADINLDNPQSFTALRTLLSTYSALPIPEFPLAIVLMGNFVTSATMAGVPGQGSIEYKEHFNALASVLADFPQLIARTTLVFVPGDNDAWPSAFSAGAAVPLPRKAVPEIFTSRIKRVIQEANREVGGAGKRKEGEAIWTTNPSRLTWFGVQGEMVLFRDDVTGRLRRSAIRFKKPEGDDEDDEEMDLEEHRDNSREATVASVMERPGGDGAGETMEVDQEPQQPKAQQNGEQQLDPDTLTARALTRTLLDQSHLSPFPLHVRPVHWDYAHVMGLYPLPTALVVADKDAPAFALKYQGCAVMNPGRIVDGRKGDRARWVEFDVREGRGAVRVEG